MPNCWTSRTAHCELLDWPRTSSIVGHAGLYGVFDRRTDSVIVQTGKVSY